MIRRSGSMRRLRPLEDVFRTGVVGDLSDAELIERFLRDRDGRDPAFAALVERHGPMVLRVCMQALDDPHSAEDAAQATFLVLARRAGSIRNRTSVSSWLFGVARRASARIRMEEARRRRFESKAAARESAEAPEPPDPYPELHAEIDRLPEKYRLPIVLCYFEGLTHEQAAIRLRWPVGTVKTRLSRGRERLRSRLELHGHPLWPLLRPDLHPAGTITRASMSGGAASSTVLQIAREVTRSMVIHKLKSTAAAMVGLCLLGLGVLVAAQQAPGQDRAVPIATSPLYLDGATDYDPATVTIVRLPFDGRVDKVLVDLGAVIKRDQPLLEFFSVDLASAKADYEMAVGQWNHDRTILDYKKSLVSNNTLPRKELIDAATDEAQGRLKMKLARDKLLVYGLTEKEIEAISHEDGQDKARMALRARGQGVLIRRDVVPGNYYDAKDTLMTIAPLDHLWVQGHVSERDADRIEVGQDVRVIFPFSKRGQEIESKVDFIDRSIDPETRTARFRVTIPNPGGRYKAGAFVRLELDTDGRRPGKRPPTVGAPSRAATTADRLDALGRKLDRLLGEETDRSSDPRILERLDALERKVDRLLEQRKAP